LLMLNQSSFNCFIYLIRFSQIRSSIFYHTIYIHLSTYSLQPNLYFFFY
jgi:hypothetical protein